MIAIIDVNYIITIHNDCTYHFKSTTNPQIYMVEHVFFIGIKLS